MQKSPYGQKLKRILARPFFHDPRTMLGLWLLLPVVSWLLKMCSMRFNNFLIYRYVYWHAVDKLSLYTTYAEHEDSNHYGPLFSLVVAPFAIPPVSVGLLFWLICLSLVLFVAIRHSTFNLYQQLFILWFCAHELFTALEMQQFNVAVVALIVLSYTLIRHEHDFGAACLIMIGTFVKVYGIVGLAFFFFSRHRGKLVISLLFWAMVMLVAPMFISSPDYILSQYVEWLHSLTDKNDQNAFSYYQNISLLGMVRKISNCATYSDLWLIGSGLFLLLLPYIRFSQYKYESFQQTILASVLLFVVLFSTGSENSSYIIALVGVVIWYVSVPWQRSKVDLWIMVLVFVLSSLGHTDLMPRSFREGLIRPYALKALPCVVVWLKLCWEICTRNYAPKEIHQKDTL